MHGHHLLILITSRLTLSKNTRTVVEPCLHSSTQKTLISGISRQSINEFKEERNFESREDAKTQRGNPDKPYHFRWFQQ